MIRRLFLDHPRSVRESYIVHAGVAARFGFALIVAGLACLVHAIVPAMFTRTGSNAVTRLHARLSARGSRQGESRTVASAPASPWQLTYEI